MENLQLFYLQEVNSVFPELLFQFGTGKKINKKKERNHKNKHANKSTKRKTFDFQAKYLFNAASNKT